MKKLLLTALIAGSAMGAPSNGEFYTLSEGASPDSIRSMCRIHKSFARQTVLMRKLGTPLADLIDVDKSMFTDIALDAYRLDMDDEDGYQTFYDKVENDCLDERMK